jgi:hemoglobin/transferrin/lactoferrin receptor protein
MNRSTPPESPRREDAAWGIRAVFRRFPIRGAGRIAHPAACFAVLFLLAIDSGPVRGAEAGPTPVTREIVVTPTRTERELRQAPSSVSAVSGEDLRRSPSTGVADALRDVPGVEVFDQSIPGAKRVVIRGESGSRVLVLVDGQKISEQKSMDGAALLIDPGRIERIEIIKGPGSVLYGSEAIGGVVNIITKKGGDRPVQAEIDARYDTSADGIGGYAALFGGYRGFRYRVSGAWTDYGDRRSADETLENTGYEIQDYGLFLGYDRDNLSLGFSCDDYRSAVESRTPDGVIGETLTYFQLDLPRWDRRKFSGFAELRAIADALPRMRLDAYFQNTKKQFHNDMDLRIPMGPAGVMTMENRIVTENDQDTYGLGFQLDWVPHSDHYLILGYEPIFDRLDAFTETRSIRIAPMPPPAGTRTTSESRFSYDAEMDSHAFYVQDEWTLPADFVATLGLRQTRVDSRLKATDNPEIETRKVDDSRAVFSAGLTWSGSEAFVLRGLFSQGYRFPNLQQLFIGTVHGGADPTFPNPDLSPETSNNYEIGLRYDDGAFAADLALFRSDASDYITTRPVEGGRRFENVDAAETFGAEAAVQYDIRDWGLAPYASATWLRRKFETAALSTYDTGHPDLMGRLGLRYARDIGTSRVFGDLFLRGATEARESFSDGTTEMYGSWETLSLSFGTQFGADRRYSATVHLENLFDRRYATAASSLDEPGFHAVFKVGLSF